MRETTNRGWQAGRRMARERLVGSNLRCGREVVFLVFLLFVWLVMSDVPEEEKMGAILV